MSSSFAELARRRDELLAELRDIPDLMRGSVCERRVKCGGPGCWCAKKGSAGHPGFHLTVNVDGRTRTRYLSGPALKEVQGLVSSYRRLWKLVEALTRVHLDMFQARRKEKE